MTRPGVFAPDLSLFDGWDLLELAGELEALAATVAPDVAAVLRQLAGAARGDGPVALDLGGLGEGLRAAVGEVLMGAVDARRLAGYKAAGPLLRVATEWERWARHEPSG